MWGTCGPETGIYMGIYDFSKTGSDLSNHIDCKTTESFCRDIKLEVSVHILTNIHYTVFFKNKVYAHVDRRIVTALYSDCSTAR